jgi:predicted dehydrogenase
VALAALEHGKHIYLEKPLATNLDEARSVLTAWRRAGVVGMIGFNYRFNPLFQTVRRHIQSGRLGTLIGIRSVFSTAARPMPLWKQTRQNGGGVLLDLAAHHVDLVHLFFGQEVRQIYAELRSHHSEDDSAALELRLADGLVVQSFFSLCAVEEDRFEIYGQAGKLAVDRYRSLDVEIIEAGREFSLLNRVGRGLRALSRGPYVFKKHFAVRNEPSYREAVRQFVSAVRGNAVAAPDLQDGYRCLEVICAAERSAHTGQTLLLSSSSCGPPR